jgi:hypothetical protein
MLVMMVVNHLSQKVLALQADQQEVITKVQESRSLRFE